MRKTEKYITYLFLIALVFSCTKDDSGNDENEIVQEVVEDQKEDVNNTTSTDTSSSQNQSTSTKATYDRSSFLINIADNIRDELLKKGVIIEDLKGKTIWKFK